LRHQDVAACRSGGRRAGADKVVGVGRVVAGVQRGARVRRRLRDVLGEHQGAELGHLHRRSPVPFERRGGSPKSQLLRGHSHTDQVRFLFIRTDIKIST